MIITPPCPLARRPPNRPLFCRLIVPAADVHVVLRMLLGDSFTLHAAGATFRVDVQLHVGDRHTVVRLFVPALDVQIDLAIFRPRVARLRLSAPVMPMLTLPFWTRTAVYRPVAAAPALIVGGGNDDKNEMFPEPDGDDDEDDDDQIRYNRLGWRYNDDDDDKDDDNYDIDDDDELLGFIPVVLAPVVLAVVPAPVVPAPVVRRRMPSRKCKKKSPKQPNASKAPGPPPTRIQPGRTCKKPPGWKYGG